MFSEVGNNLKTLSVLLEWLALMLEQTPEAFLWLAPLRKQGTRLDKQVQWS